MTMSESPPDVALGLSQVPMPSILATQIPARSLRDPESGNESGPIDDPPAVVSEQPATDPVAAYARLLWATLDQVADYLLTQVARGGGGPILGQAAPLLRSDDEWQKWRAAYAATLSVLAGPAGDQGYAEQQARLEYQNGFGPGPN
jgi:hypothetical protein